jgi:hypothetical protein
MSSTTTGRTTVCTRCAKEGGPYNMLTPEDVVHTDRLTPDRELSAYNYKEFCRSCGEEDISAFIVCDGCGSRIGTDCCVFCK